MKNLIILWGVAISLYSGVLTTDIAPPHFDFSHTKIRFLDQKILTDHTIGGEKFSEISDLAYLAEKEKLFMISDEGKLFVFHARFGKKIEVLEPLEAAVLSKKSGKPFKKWRRDSEGMTLDGRGRLLISFEGKAKIGWFHKNSQKIGQRIKKYKLPSVLRKADRYRSKNKSLEALAWHPKYGVLTVTEWPLKKDDKKYQTIYALNGRQWHFKAEPEDKSAVSAIEVMDDGNVLVLERSFTGLLNPFVVTLKKVYLDQCQNGMCRTEVLLKMNSHEGWGVDNFEGLARVGKERYLMVSDDNDNFFQQTLLIYFEVKK
jgi:hypothetical protein